MFGKTENESLPEEHEQIEEEELQAVEDMLKKNADFRDCLVKEIATKGEEAGMQRWTMLHEYPSTQDDRKRPDKLQPSGSPGTEDDYVKMGGGRYESRLWFCLRHSSI